jgi:DNA invertase Pin-like site-specific DNA recombinase
LETLAHEVSDVEGESFHPFVIYAAKSTEDRHGSIPGQLDDLRSLAERERAVTVEAFQDEGFSGYSGNRGPGLAAAMARAERLALEHGSCTLAAWHSDRFARGDGAAAQHLAEILFWAMKKGVQLRTVQDDAMVANPLMAMIAGMQNHADSQRKSVGVKKGMLGAVKRGTHVGRRPFGYRPDMTPDPLTAPILQGIYAAALRGESLHEISRRLNRDRVPTAHGAEWRGSTVRRLFLTLAYVGRQTYDGREYAGTWEPLIREADFDTARALIMARAKGTGGRGGRPASSAFLFTGGLLRCECGAAMVPRSHANRRGGRYEVYRCDRGRRDLAACSMPTLRRAIIDDAVICHLVQVGIDVEATAAELLRGEQLRLAEARALAHQAEAARARAEAEWQRVESDYLAEKLSAETFERLSAKLAGQLEAATAEAEQLAQRHREATANSDASDAKSEVMRRLTSIRQTIAGHLAAADASGVQAMRVALLLLFEEFTLRRLGAEAVDPEWMPDGRGWEPHLLIPGALYIEPLIRPSARILAGAEVALPELHRVPVHLARENSTIGFRR